MATTQTCGKCAGTGKVDLPQPGTCPTCGGTGTVER